MKPLLIIILVFLAFQKAYGQDSVRVVREYNNDKPKSSIDSFFNNIPNTIFISLDEGFDDSLYITVNDKVILNQYLKTDASIGLAGGFIITFDTLSDIKILKLKFVKANVYIEEKLYLTYKSLQIRGPKHWLLIYTNQFPMRE